MLVLLYNLELHKIMRIYKLIFVFTFSFAAVISCSQKDEVVNFEEITTSSKKYKEGQKSEQKEGSDSIVLSNFITSFLDSIQFPIRQIQKIKRLDFIDRFENQEFDKIQINRTNDTIQMSYWRYKDSIITKSTFYNWLDENQVSLFETKKLSKTPFCLVVTSDKIIELKYQKTIELDKWLPYLIEPKDSLFFLINQLKKKNCVWLNKDLEEVKKF